MAKKTSRESGKPFIRASDRRAALMEYRYQPANLCPPCGLPWHPCGPCFEFDKHKDEWAAIYGNPQNKRVAVDGDI